MWFVLWMACSGTPDVEPAVEPTPEPVAEAPAEVAEPQPEVTPEAEAPVGEEAPACEAGATGDAQALNVAGMRCYDRGELGVAARHFRAALEKDPAHVLAHYNLACTLSLLRAKGEICPNDAYVGEILTHLRESVRLDERRRARLVADSDLESVHHTLGYLALAGKDLTRPPVLEAELPGFVLYGPSNGAFGHRLEVHLHADGKATWRTMNLGDDGSVSWAESTATWEASAPSRIALTHGGTTTELTVTDDGRFTPDQGDAFTDHPDDCSA